MQIKTNLEIIDFEYHAPDPREAWRKVIINKLIDVKHGGLEIFGIIKSSKLDIRFFLYFAVFHPD